MRVVSHILIRHFLYIDCIPNTIMYNFSEARTVERDSADITLPKFIYYLYNIFQIFFLLKLHVFMYEHFTNLKVRLSSFYKFIFIITHSYCQVGCHTVQKNKYLLADGANMYKLIII